MGSRRSTNVPKESVSVPSTKVCFASLDSVADSDPFHFPESFLNVPWLAQYYWRSTELVNKYVCAGMFPGRVTVRDLQFPERDLHLVIPAGNLLRRPHESTERARTELLRILHKRLRWVRPGYPVNVYYDLDTWAFRSFGE